MTKLTITLNETKQQYSNIHVHVHVSEPQQVFSDQNFIVSNEFNNLMNQFYNGWQLATSDQLLYMYKRVSERAVHPTREYLLL